MRRIGALGVVVSLVALVSASAADGAGPGPAEDVFTAIVGSILGGPTSWVHGTDGRHYVVYELVLTNAKAVPATLQAVEVLDSKFDFVGVVEEAALDAALSGAAGLPLRSSLSPTKRERQLPLDRAFIDF